jgi:hypothetical protein
MREGKEMNRKEQIARVRVVLTMVRGRGLRIHSYSVTQLREAARALLLDPYYEVVPDRKLIEAFVNGDVK